MRISDALVVLNLGDTGMNNSLYMASAVGIGKNKYFS